MRGLGNLQFGPREQSTVDDDPRYESRPQIADIDGDGKPDIVTTGWNGLPPDQILIRYGLGPQLVPAPADGIDFGYVELGTRLPPQAVSFTNIGPGTATALAREGEGDLGDFPISGDTCSGGPRRSHRRPRRSHRPPPPAPTVAPPPVVPSSAVSKPRVVRTTGRVLLRRGVRFTQTSPSAGRVRWTLSLPSTNPARRVVVGRATRTSTRAGSVRVVVKLTRAGARHVTRRRAGRLILRTSFIPAGTTRATVRSTTVRLRT